MKSAVDQRRTEIDRHLTRLRTQLARKSLKDFTTDFRYRSWLEGTNELIAKLLEELSALDDPGEYNELPVAVVADELGLRLDQIKGLIKLGEVEAVGQHACLRVCRAELERLVQLGHGTHMVLAAQGAEHIFTEAVEKLKVGDVAAARRAYSRIKARETCIGDYALALEITLGLAEGRYDDAGRAVGFVLGERVQHRDAICLHLTGALRRARFKSDKARGEALKLLKLLGADSAGISEQAAGDGGTEMTALYLAAAAHEAVRELVTKHLPQPHMEEFTRSLRDAIFTALYARAHAGTSVRSMSYLNELENQVPHFWEPLHLLEELRED